MRTAYRPVLATLAAGLLVCTMATAGTAAEEPAATEERAAAETCVPAAIPFDAEDIHLTGLWSADNGTIYYVRQVDDKIWLAGMSDYRQERGEVGREATSVGYGTLTGTSVSLEVADVPRGQVYNAGTIEVTVGADDDGNLQAHAPAPDGSTTTFTPCSPEAIRASEFLRPFSFTVPFGLASTNSDFPDTTDLRVLWTPDVPESGISFWALGPGWEASCSEPSDLPAPEDWTPASIEAYLRAIPELSVSEASKATVAGLPATVLDVTATPDAMGCDGDEWVRLFRQSGNESGLVPRGSARLSLVDTGGATFAIELWGPDPETWWPIGQTIIDSLNSNLRPSDGPSASAADELTGSAERAQRRPVPWRRPCSVSSS